MNFFKESCLECPRVKAVHNFKLLDELPDIKDKNVFSFVREDCNYTYFHWLFESFYSLLTFKDKEKIDYYYMPSRCSCNAVHYSCSLNSFVHHSLYLTGISPEKMIDSNTFPDVVPNIKAQIKSCWNPSSEVISLIKSSLCKNIPEDKYIKSKKIYISREDAIFKRISNEKEVTAYLSNKGFETITLSSLTLSEQIQLFRSASIVIGAHGAGLTNIMFCKPHTLVLEIFKSTGDVYKLIASECNLQYTHISINDLYRKFSEPLSIELLDETLKNYSNRSIKI